MYDPTATRAQQLAETVSAFERERTGRSPQWAAAVLGGETLVVTLRGALSPAEEALAHTPEGDGLVREFHRTLFASASGPLCQEIARITGVGVLEAAADAHGATGTVVLVFLLAGSVPAETWSSGPHE